MSSASIGAMLLDRAANVASLSAELFSSRISLVTLLHAAPRLFTNAMHLRTHRRRAEAKRRRHEKRQHRDSATQPPRPSCATAEGTSTDGRDGHSAEGSPKPDDDQEPPWFTWKSASDLCFLVVHEIGQTTFRRFVASYMSAVLLLSDLQIASHPTMQGRGRRGRLLEPLRQWLTASAIRFAVYPQLQAAMYRRTGLPRVSSWLWRQSWGRVGSALWSLLRLGLQPLLVFSSGMTEKASSPTRDSESSSHAAPEVLDAWEYIVLCLTDREGKRSRAEGHFSRDVLGLNETVATDAAAVNTTVGLQTSSPSAVERYHREWDEQNNGASQWNRSSWRMLTPVATVVLQHATMDLIAFAMQQNVKWCQLYAASLMEAGKQCSVAESQLAALLTPVAAIVKLDVEKAGH